MRRYVRQSTNLAIDIQAQSPTGKVNDDCAMKTLSKGGLSFQLSTEVNVGTEVQIHIDAVSPPYRGSGEIVWCQQNGEHFEVGVRFTDKEEAYKARMVQQVCQIEQYKKHVFEQQGRVLSAEQAAAEWIDKFADSFSPKA